MPDKRFFILLFYILLVQLPFCELSITVREIFLKLLLHRLIFYQIRLPGSDKDCQLLEIIGNKATDNRTTFKHGCEL